MSLDMAPPTERVNPGFIFFFFNLLQAHGSSFLQTYMPFFAALEFGQ